MKERVQLIFKWLSSHFNHLGFNIGFYDEMGNSFNFTKLENDLCYYIRLSHYIKGNRLTLNARIYSCIVSKNVNAILNKIVKTEGELEDTLLTYPNYDKNIGEASLGQLEKLYINSEEEFEVAWKIIAVHIERYIIPFFEKVPNLQAINDNIINKTSYREYSTYIKGETNFKVFIIMKLCNNPEYENFREKLIGVYNKAIEIDAVKYRSDYEAFLQLLDYLDSGKYIEVLN